MSDAPDDRLLQLQKENAELQANLQGLRAERILHLEEANAELQKHLDAAPTEQTHIARKHYTRQGERLAAQSDQIRGMLAEIDLLKKDRERLKGIVMGMHEQMKVHVNMLDDDKLA